jgi:hypothetical protein
MTLSVKYFSCSHSHLAANIQPVSVCVSNDEQIKAISKSETAKQAFFYVIESDSSCWDSFNSLSSTLLYVLFSWIDGWNGRIREKKWKKVIWNWNKRSKIIVLFLSSSILISNDEPIQPKQASFLLFRAFYIFFSGWRE